MGEDGDGGGSVGSGADIDWSALNAKLPYERTESSQNKRKKMFKDFDPNRNGYLSLAEVRFYSTRFATDSAFKPMRFVDAG